MKENSPICARPSQASIATRKGNFINRTIRIMIVAFTNRTPNVSDEISNGLWTTN